MLSAIYRPRNITSIELKFLKYIYRYVDLLRFGVKSWNEKQQIIQRKTKGIYWPSTTLPSLSTTLPRARYMNGDGLPRFETPQVSDLINNQTC